MEEKDLSEAIFKEFHPLKAKDSIWVLLTWLRSTSRAQ